MKGARSGTCSATVVFALLLPAGCAVGTRGSFLPKGGARKFAPVPRVADRLPAAKGDEFTGLMTQTEPGRVAPGRPADRPGSYGFRLGYLATVVADETGWDPALCAGLYYRRAKAPWPRSVLEVGFDYVPLGRGDGSVSSTLYLARGEVLLGNWDPDARKASPYFLGGANVVSERGTQEVSGDEGSALASGINVGLGFGSTRGTWDLRGVYSLFPGSENVKANILLAAGFSF